LAVKDGQNGLFIRPRNSKEIAEKVNQLLNDEGLRLKMANKARQIAVERFSWEAIANRFENIYEKFAAPPSSK
jgi:glycosyltransferase involved in cell wall biosynthesis